MTFRELLEKKADMADIIKAFKKEGVLFKVVDYDTLAGRVDSIQVIDDVMDNFSFDYQVSGGKGITYIELNGMRESKMSLGDFKKHLINGDVITVDNGGMDSDVLSYRTTKKYFMLNMDKIDVKDAYDMYKGAKDNMVTESFKQVQVVLKDALDDFEGRKGKDLLVDFVYKDETYTWNGGEDPKNVEKILKAKKFDFALSFEGDEITNIPFSKVTSVDFDWN